VIARILLWSLFESTTTLEELRTLLPALEPPSTWLWNQGSERFGLLAFGDELPAGVERVRDLIGTDPEVAEEFDTLERLSL
jgi:hypothetical protein